jgi:ammonia channel protein AmtB
MSYEAGVARRKNVMATAMKNILTIAVVTPTFYYFGWWIYNCNQPGLPIGPNSSDFTSVACQGGIPWSDAFGPNLTNNINLIFFLAFLLFSWTTASRTWSWRRSSARSSGSSTPPGAGAPAAG